MRRKSGAANDLWAWAGLAVGLGAVTAGYVTGTSPVQVWLVGTVDRVTEFPGLDRLVDRGHVGIDGQRRAPAPCGDGVPVRHATLDPMSSR